MAFIYIDATNWFITPSTYRISINFSLLLLFRRQIRSHNTINSKSFRWRIWSDGKKFRQFEIIFVINRNVFVILLIIPAVSNRLRTRTVSRSSLVSIHISIMFDVFALSSSARVNFVIVIHTGIGVKIWHFYWIQLN